MLSQAEFKIEHDVKTNEILVIELSAAEIKELEKTRKLALELSNAEQNELEKLKQDKGALLAKLGITEDEAKLLLS